MPDSNLDLKPSGKIVVNMGGEGTFHLRAPKLGEFKELRLWLERFNEENAQITAENLAHANDTDWKILEQRDEIDGVVDWLGVAFKLLCEGDVPDPDNWPTWLVNDQIIATMLKHWREVPLAHGSR